MHRTVLGLCVVAGLGLTGYLLAGDGGGEKKGCGSAALASKEVCSCGCGGACGGSCCGKCTCKASCCTEGGSAGKVAQNAHYKRANELLKSWQEAPVRLAAMSETEKTDLEAAFKKLHEVHPVVAAFEPTMVFLHEGLATLTQIDAAAKQLCAKAATTTRQPAAENTCGDTAALAKSDEPKCPQTAAAVASAKSKMKQSVALTAKANELMLVAYQAACAGKRECSKSGGEAVRLASAEEKPAKAAGGCCGGGKSDAKLAAVTDNAEQAETRGGCCSGSKTAATVAGSAGQPGVKTLVTRSEKLVAQSGQLLAQWQVAGIRLAGMEGADRESVEKLASTVMVSCPVGSRMPDTLETIAGLLHDAAALNGQAMADCCRNAGVAKDTPAASKELAEARLQVISAILNVLEKSNGTMRSPRQVASAQ